VRVEVVGRKGRGRKREGEIKRETESGRRRNQYLCLRREITVNVVQLLLEPPAKHLIRLIDHQHFQVLCFETPD
jgi:hypothetical protein